MKTVLAILTFVGWVLASHAAPIFSDIATAAPPAVLFRTDWAPMPRPATNNNLRAGVETEITSHRADFDLRGRMAIYSGNVHVKDPRMDLTCELLTVKMSSSGGKFDTVIAEKSVSMEFLDDRGQRIHGTGGRAVYTYKVTKNFTNDVIELFDDPILETVQGTWKGDVITLDRANNNIRATNSRMIIRPEPGSENSHTPLMAPPNLPPR